jgi:hypothetical protein
MHSKFSYHQIRKYNIIAASMLFAVPCSKASAAYLSTGSYKRGIYGRMGLDKQNLNAACSDDAHIKRYLGKQFSNYKTSKEISGYDHREDA